MKKYIFPTTCMLTVVIAIVISFLWGMLYSGYRTDAQLSNHDLLAKRIFLSKPNDILVNFELLRADLRKDLAYYDGKVSLYFEYLPTGTSVRIGESEHLVAASLLKVPAVMQLYQLVEQDDVNLDDTVTLKEEWLDSGYGDLYKKRAGYTSTIREFAKIALEKSDNTALNAVQSVVDAHVTEKTTNVYETLDVDYVDDSQTNLSLSARAYASFLKCLYFACYISPDSSQEIMTYLTQSTYGEDGRLGKYIPREVKIAHKIGVAGNQVQSDCGIVYVPNRHYILCVMLNEEQGRGGEVIAQLSKKVYDYVVAK